MKTRAEVQKLLEEVLGSKNVYFQPPPNTSIKYPCFVFKFNKFHRRNADNTPYILTGCWEVHHMYKSVNNDLKEKMLFIAPWVEYDRRIVADGVYNDYYTIYQ